MKPQIFLDSDSRSLAGINRPAFEKILRSAIKKFAPKAAHTSVDLKFVKSAEMKKLNKRFRKKNKATDVLSFEIHRGGLLGAIVIDLQTATKQAKTYKHSLRQEIRELFVHGVMHLLGFDHEKEADARKMFRAETLVNRLWTKS